VRRALLERLLAAAGSNVPTALVTDLATGAQALVNVTGLEGELTLVEADLVQVRQGLHDDRSGPLETATGTVFVEVWSPKPRLLVIGAVHTAQELVPLARTAGYDVTVIDPRTAFGAPARFPGTTVLNDWPDDIVPALAPDRQTAILTLTHDPKIDDPALVAALRSEAFYIGALGSRRTHTQRLERLQEAGFDATTLARIHGPVGLAIGARTPVEIAISIMAEITAVRRHAPLGHR
jgi:xanthine dehydrogenase accessory factor